jgi:hypothetical protein
MHAMPAIAAPHGNRGQGNGSGISLGEGQNDACKESLQANTSTLSAPTVL